MYDTVSPALAGGNQASQSLSLSSKGINYHVTKSVVPMALALRRCTPTSNAVGMADLVTPTLGGGNA